MRVRRSVSKNETLYSSSESGDVVLQFFSDSFALDSFAPCCFKQVILFDIVRLNTKRNCICFTLISELQNIAFRVKVKIDANENRTKQTKKDLKKILKAVTVNTTF